MLMTAICPACEVGELRATKENTTITYQGERLVVVGTHFSVCPNCGEEVVLPEQAKINEILYADAKKAKEDLWISERIVAFRAAWGLSQQDASRLFGGGANAFSKYERGEVIHSRSMDLLMKVFDASAEAREYLGGRCGIDRWQHRNWQPVQEIVVELPRETSQRTVVDFLEYRRQMEEGLEAANNETWHDLEVEAEEVEELSYGVR
jgi:putative zinc finger/helix-turn-helix YgiT family protein